MFSYNVIIVKELMSNLGTVFEQSTTKGEAIFLAVANILTLEPHAELNILKCQQVAIGINV
jgi:hypothetical protein